MNDQSPANDPQQAAPSASQAPALDPGAIARVYLADLNPNDQFVLGVPNDNLSNATYGGFPDYIRASIDQAPFFTLPREEPVVADTSGATQAGDQTQSDSSTNSDTAAAQQGEQQDTTPTTGAKTSARKSAQANTATDAAPSQVAG